MTDKYFSVYKPTCSIAEAFAVYKMLSSSEQFLKAKYFNGSNRESMYRKLARVVHPDKNLHP